MRPLDWLLKAATILGLVCGLLNAREPATAIATVTAGFVTAITVNSSGSGYTVEPAVTLSGGGGSGAGAKAILAGDKVSSIVVITAGSGYTTAPTVMVEAPAKALGVRLRLVPELTVEGLPGSTARVEWAENIAGVWTTWSNVVVRADGVVLVDLSAGFTERFYRAVADPRPVGPEGFVWIQPGNFLMGSPMNEAGREGQEVQHLVSLTQGFWLSDHEVTQAEYKDVVGRNPSSRLQSNPNDLGLEFHYRNHPVDQVSWEDAVAYCKKLTERERVAGHITSLYAYRLPTEAEWEYAARAGTKGARYGDLDSTAWYNINASSQTISVKSKTPNAWGVCDMIGNVWEWCSDWYSPGSYGSASVVDPLGPDGPGPGSSRVIRGGSVGDDAGSARAAKRSGGDLRFRGAYVGFRPALSSVR